MSLGVAGFKRKTKRTRKREFLDEMNLVVPWAELVALISPHAPQPRAKGGRPPFGVQTVLRIHFLQQWFNLSDPAMEEALYDTPMFRDFAILEQLEKTKASIRAKVEHPFWVIKRQFCYSKVKYQGLAKNTANLVMLFALSNLWMVRERLLNMAARV